MGSDGGETREQKQGGDIEALRFRPILGQIAAGYRHDWKLLLGAGLVVFGLIGVVSSLDPFDGNTLGDWSGGWSIVLALIIAAQISIPLIGAVFYSGVVATGEERRRLGVEHGLLDVARNLPYKNLILADFALVAVLAAGFVALLIPGFIFLTWFTLIAPLIEMERLGVRAAFRRSRALVRPHFRRVAGVVIPLVILEGILENGGESVGHSLLGEGYLGTWLGSVIANLLASPLYALTVLALYFEITARER